jgi:hypothetical protein
MAMNETVALCERCQVRNPALVWQAKLEFEKIMDPNVPVWPLACLDTPAPSASLSHDPLSHDIFVVSLLLLLVCLLAMR